jgi:septal ring factor EnvC (AmiA/AmiB activator)
VAGVLFASVVTAQPSSDRLEVVRREIARLQTELDDLSRREEGLLGELERLGAEARLRRAERDEVGIRLETTRAELGRRDQKLTGLQDAQAERREYLAVRLRQIYKDGPQRTLRALLGDGGVDGYWSGLRYASFLSERDGREIAEFRRTSEELREQRDRLAKSRDELERLAGEISTAERRLERSRLKRTELVEAVREDKVRRETAVQELESASAALGAVVGSLDASEVGSLDVHKFRGLLDWPMLGRVSAGFGTVVHPRFKTRVPHPGIDIDAPDGERILSVFDGRVVFAAWMRGYGLTVIVDHGGGVMSIYAHASVIVVEVGQRVLRGDSLGRIGDTGSLRGAYLYFELRLDGKPTDPREWLRPEAS